MSDLARPLGLRLNSAKCVGMHFGATSKPPTLIINEKKIEIVQSFVYLGTAISARPSADDEVARRRNAARAQTRKMTPLWKDPAVNPNVKMRVFYSHVRPILVYALHVAPLTAGQEKSLDACERSLIRWALGLSYPDDWPSNAKLAQRLRKLPASRHATAPSVWLRRARLSWTGHCLRAPVTSIARRVLFADQQPRRTTPGYLQKTWTDGVLGETMKWHAARSKRDGQLAQMNALHVLATNRREWRTRVNK